MQGGAAKGLALTAYTLIAFLENDVSPITRLQLLVLSVLLVVYLHECTFIVRAFAQTSIYLFTMHVRARVGTFGKTEYVYVGFRG